MKYASLFLTIFFLVPAGCQMLVEEGGHEEVLTLEVAPDRVPCVGEMTGLCIQVRAPGETAWRKFYDPIEGFEHEEGVRYTLELGRSEVRNPPADGSSFHYRLIRVIRRQAGGSPGG